MFSSNQVSGYLSSNSENFCESEFKKRETLLNSKTYYLNKSLSKYISVGLSTRDFSIKVVVGGQNGYTVCFKEEDWKEYVKHQGVITNYFYCSNSTTFPITFDDIVIEFEKTHQLTVIKIKNKYKNYVSLARETVDKLWEIQELINYRIQILKQQEFEKYFGTFQSNVFSPNENILDTIYNVLNPRANQNSENISTMLEFLTFYPEDLENKLKSTRKRKYYEEISNY